MPKASNPWLVMILRTHMIVFILAVFHLLAFFFNSCSERQGRKSDVLVLEVVDTCGADVLLRCAFKEIMRVVRVNFQRSMAVLSVDYSPSTCQTPPSNSGFSGVNSTLASLTIT